MSNTYLLLSLPTSITLSNDHDDALTAVRSVIGNDNGATVPFQIPEFKVGTLDALVQQADELAKLSGGCEAVVQKVGDSLKNVLEGNEEQINEQKKVNDKPVDAYLKNFRWNKVKYRADKPLAELISTLQKEVTSIDNDVRTKYNQYNNTKSTYLNLQKKQTGNLSSKSLVSVVPPSALVRDSEYLETHLVAVPRTSARDFPRMYETISPWVVPRSGQQLASDDEFALFGVTTFKKYSADFVHKCREQKWIPREYRFEEGGGEAEKRELDRVAKDERKLWSETLMLGRTGWGEAVAAWAHVLALRVFVETVLRYGLPLSFVSGLVVTSPKQVKKIRDNLDKEYGYLGGNALVRDKKGNITKDDSSTADGMQMVGGGDADYSPYVYYEFEVI